MARRRAIQLTASCSIELPADWTHEVEDRLVTIFDPDGPGALQFSSATKTEGGDMSDTDLLGAIEDLRLAGVPRRAAACGPFVGYTMSREEDGSLGQYWFLRAGTLLLFVTYFCAKEDVGRERAAVKVALDSLRLA